MKEIPIMKLPAVSENSTLRDAASLFLSANSRVLVVVNGVIKPVGLLDVKEILPYFINDLPTDKPVSTIVSSDFEVVSRDAVEQSPGVFRNKEYYIVVDAEGRYVGVISQLDYLRCQLKKAQERITYLSTAINSSHDGICFSDGQANLVENNEAFYRITGLSPEEVLGKDGSYLTKHGLISKSIVREVLKTKKPVTTFQTYHTGKTCMNTANPVFNDRGEISMVVTNVRDITELTRLKEQLSATKELSQRYEDELTQLRYEKYKQNKVVAQSEKMNKVMELAYRVGQVDSTVLITGETGVGKEIIANTIHLFSPQRNKNTFIKINCAALPENLLESELFGYEKGAFTGARTEGKPGKFELAQNGTIFLDEIADMSLPLQAKLLRVIQEKEVTRLGGTKSISLNVRIIAATNQELEKLLSEGKFRKDLYYRLNVVSIHIPPLRERRSDIRPLALFFLNKYNAKYNRERMLSAKVLEILEQYDWPGNIRELENLIENLVVLSQEQFIEPHDLPENFRNNDFVKYYSSELTLDEILSKVEKEVLKQALAEYRMAKDAAKVLGVSPATICRKAQKYGL
ncbi:MAG: sigma 54-interacting transcriptional regulator [Bacillota bacterium]